MKNAAVGVLPFLLVVSWTTVFAEEATETSPVLDTGSLDGYQLLPEASLLDDNDAEKRAWRDLGNTWGKRSGNWRELQSVWGKRANDWRDLQSMWGKRAWEKFQGSWGKKDGGNNWNSFRGSWGKRREPGWNNLKGLWGKRAADGQNWSKLSGYWGKRR